MRIASYGKTFLSCYHHRSPSLRLVVHTFLAARKRWPAGALYLRCYRRGIVLSWVVTGCVGVSWAPSYPFAR